MKKPSDPKPETADAEDRTPNESVPARRSAMKLPPGVVPKTGGAGVPGGRGPAWGRGEQGRPQRDAARRAGKSRKVH